MYRTSNRRVAGFVDVLGVGDGILRVKVIPLDPKGRKTIVQRVLRSPIFWIAVAVAVVVILVLTVGGGGGGGGVGY
jgi:hypothetical protein